MILMPCPNNVSYINMDLSSYLKEAKEIHHREGVAVTVFMMIGICSTMAYICRIVGYRMGVKRKV